MNEGGMRAFREQQEREKLAREFAESCEQSEIELRQLLLDLDTALADWMRTYAPEQCSRKSIIEASKRINAHGGTLAYIAALRERIRRASR